MRTNRVILGFIFLVLPYLFNHIDFLFPKFEGEFMFFGNRLSVAEGLNSSDLIWTITQKSNLILLYIAFFILSPFKRKSKASYALSAILLICIVYSIYLSIEAFQDYTRGFNDQMFLRTFISLILIALFVFFIISRIFQSIIRKRRLEIENLKKIIEQKIVALKQEEEKLKGIKEKINSKVGSIEERNFKIIKTIEDYEILYSQFRFFDNMDDWAVHTQFRSKKIYAQIAKQFEELEDIRI